MQLSLREIGKVFSCIAIYTTTLGNSKCPFPFLVGVLTVIKIKLPNIYLKLKNNSITFEELCVAIRLNEFEESKFHRIRKDWMEAYLKYCLLSNEEVKNEGDDSEVKKLNIAAEYDVPRKEIIAMTCNSLDVFKIQDK